MNGNADPNPYRSTNVNANGALASDRALRYLAHGIYLQLFIGVGFLTMSEVGANVGSLFAGPKACGALLVGLALNSLIYVHRYKRSLR